MQLSKYGINNPFLLVVHQNFSFIQVLLLLQFNYLSGSF